MDFLPSCSTGFYSNLEEYQFFIFLTKVEIESVFSIHWLKPVSIETVVSKWHVEFPPSLDGACEILPLFGFRQTFHGLN
ncbi:hypothetical protein EGI26_19735 [Lacihabitans sp. CCS-44]|nr:hypothetical protein [Lacihabitans sp. CCS-44]